MSPIHLGMELEQVLEAMDKFEENVLEQIQWLLDHALKSGVRERTSDSPNKQIIDLTYDSPRRPIADLHPSPPKDVFMFHMMSIVNCSYITSCIEAFASGNELEKSFGLGCQLPIPKNKRKCSL